MTEQMDFQKDLLIDETALDVEWLDQPRLFMKYATASAAARRDADLAKDQLDVVRAQIDSAIRAEPEKFGINKLTETAVASKLTEHPDVQDAQEKLREAKYQAALLSSAVSAMETRKVALENLVRLFGQSYFAGPKEPRDLPVEVRRRHETDMDNARVKRAMKRGKGKEKADED